MNELGAWLQGELRRRDLTQMQLAAYAGIGQATVSGILNKGHVPKVETLFRLADFFGTPREEVLRLVGYLPQAPLAVEPEAALDDDEEALLRTLIEEFRQVPDEWKPVAVEQVSQFRRLAELRPVRVIGDEAGDLPLASDGLETEDGAEERDGETARSEAA